jgi:preprotein translocase subunit SecD
MNEINILPGVAEVKVLKHWVEEAFLAKKISLGLDLQGGMHLVLQANFEGIQEKLGRELTEKDRNEITQQALELLRNRIDKFGVSEPSIRPRGNEAIEIQLPGVKDPEGVKNAIGTTGRLEYRIVDDKYTELATKLYNEKYKENGVPAEETAHLEFVKKLGDEIGLPDDLEILFFYSRDNETGEIFPDYPMALSKDVSLAGTDIQEAVVDRDEYGQIIVMFRTTAEGAAKFARATSEPNHGKRLAIVLDNKVRNAPSIRETIASGSGNISGGFTYDEATTLARIIKEGALPVDLRIIEERTVGPSLGQDSIESGVKAGIIGLIGVMCFMLLYYKAAGIIANIGLALNMIFMLALLSLLGFTLTLPGIAGFILTVGMAVDANVIIFERIKEELKKGKSVRMAIVSGYDRAFWTVFDANLTTMIAAFILSQFGTGPIKGFAVTLFIGILTSMFTALYVTRFIYELISLNKKIKKLYI